MNNKRRIISTAALIYANGSVHLGHLVEYIQADIWVRFQKMRGHEIYYICGSDCHGTPIMTKAQQLGIEPEVLVQQSAQEQLADFAKFHIEFDAFELTHSEENKALVYGMYEKLKANGDIETRTIEQAFDPEKNMFLPDRFIKGQCPKCKAEDQYGDGCEACGSTYNPTDLIHPRSVLSGATPITKQTEHFFFKLSHYEDFLKQWTRGDQLQTEISNKLSEWFEAGLKDWDISRDAPYFGFDIPNEPGKYFYVWLDAPVGYMASFLRVCQERGLDFNSFWSRNSDAELYHFIGKDIVYFHALFWPAMLHGADYRTPTAIFSHSFLTVNGKKMSKSRGTFINASTFAEHINPELLRYYFAAKLSNTIEDIDFSPNDFVLRVNADLVGKLVNIASRCAGFIHKYFESTLNRGTQSHPLWISFLTHSETIAALYEQREFSHAIREIMQLADKANQYIDEHKPWQLVKNPEQMDKAHEVCSVALNLFRVLITFLKPVLPETAQKVEAFLGCTSLSWTNIGTALENHTIQPFTPLLTRVEETQLNAIFQA